MIPIDAGIGKMTAVSSDEYHWKKQEQAEKIARYSTLAEEIECIWEVKTDATEHTFIGLDTNAVWGRMQNTYSMHAHDSARQNLLIRVKFVPETLVNLMTQNE